MALGTWELAVANGANVTVPSGTGRIATCVLTITAATAPSDITATLGGVSMTAHARVVSTNASGDKSVLAVFTLLDAALPAAGARALSTVITGGTGLGNGYRSFMCADGREQGTLTLTSAATAAASASLATGNRAVLAGDYGLTFVAGNAVGGTGFSLTSALGATFTERWDPAGVQAGADTTYGAGGTDNVTWTSTVSTNNLSVALLVLPAPVTGPTITVQPVADTVILTNETTASFSVTATGTGGLTYDWELETSVGGGVYANLANGSGATWTGQTAATCSAALTAKTLSGRRVRCNVTDSNGTTTSTAVALTIYDGPQLTTFPATNGSGVSTATLTCDYVTGTGEFVEVAIPLADGRLAVTVTVTA